MSLMASYLLHGLWLPVSGLSLWIERVDGHKIVTPQAVPEGTFPSAVDALLANKSFRNRARVSLRTPKGKDVSLMAPMAMFAPDESVVALSQLSFLDDRSPAASAEQRAAIAPDLMWLIRAYRGLTRFVRAGRVTMRLSYQGGEWFPMWQLASGLGERGWLGEMISAAPGILTINNRSLSEDLADELTHWIAFADLKHLTEESRPYPWHDFAQALLTTTPIKRGKAQLLRGLNEWKDSITSVDLQLVFIVEEPPKNAALGDNPAADNTWRIRCGVRSGTASPRPVRLDELDRGSVEKLRDAQTRALTIAPALNPARSLPPTGYFADAGDWDVFVSTDTLVNFISNGAEALRKAGFSVMLPKAWAQLETTATVDTRSLDDAEGATKAHIGLENLVEYDWRISVGDTELTEEEMANLVNSKSGLIKLRGDWVMADTQAVGRIAKYMQELQKSREKGDGDDKLGLSGTASMSDLRELALESAGKDPIEFTGSTWHASLLGGMETPAPERVDIPDTVRAELRPYQRRGVDWLYWMSRNNIGAVLADDMGLGKTLQLLSLLAVERAEAKANAAPDELPEDYRVGPTLVVAPTSVVGNWAREAEKFVPSLKVLVHHGTNRLKDDDLLTVANAADIVITSYGTIGRDYTLLGQVEWDRVVLDEAQAIKNSGTRSSKAVRSLPSRHRLALTGTPIENRLSEMRSILDFVNPGVLGSASFFRNHFAKAIEREDNAEMAEKLRQLTGPFILRRLKTDPNIIDDLPEKTEQILSVSLTSEQAALYKALVQDVERRLEETEGIARRGLVLATLTRIKQICNHPAHYLGDDSPVTIKGKHRSGKVAELMRIVSQAVESGERVLIFTQYKAFGAILQPYLSEQLGREVPFLHGGVTKSRRDSMVADFQHPDGPPAMLLSLKAGGTGLNLTAANIVVHMDRWWNPAVENQATDRAFRIGQNKNVQVYKMITEGTLEESIQDILDGKTKLAGSVVGEGEGWITELDSEDLALLMSYRGKE